MDVSDDALGLVLERVDSQVSLIRAAAVCRRWRRAVADPAFLRRFRSLRAPAVAGHYHNERKRKGVVPVFVPSSPPVVDARHFSLDFLRGGAGAWTVEDSRGSLLLMQGAGKGNVPLGSFPDLVVCEPLTRRCKIIPPPGDYDGGCRFMGSFLVDGCLNEAGGRISMSNFRVPCLFNRGDLLYTAMFTLAGDIGTVWSERTIDYGTLGIELARTLGHAAGSWYFYTEVRTLIVLDGSTGNFSSSVLPPLEDWDFHMWNFNFCIIAGRDGKPRIVTTIDDTMKVYAQLNNCEWALEKTLLLSEAAQGLPGYQPSFFSDPPEVLTLGAGFVILLPQNEETWAFSVDLETMEVAPAPKNMGSMVYCCELPWPPVLRACLDP